MAAVAVEGVSALAHGVHYALVAGGLVGVAWLLVPTLVPRSASSPTHVPRDRHEERVAALRAELLGVPVPRARPWSAESTLLLPVALVAATASAGVHAALGPAHLREAVLVGAFFAAAALAQLGWAALLLLRPTRAVLHTGVALHLGLLTLWAVTRTVGLPLGLMPDPEPVGAWDLAAVAWEVLAVAACLTLLHRADGTTARLRLAPWAAWHRGATLLATTSVLALGVLSVSGV